MSNGTVTTTVDKGDLDARLTRVQRAALSQPVSMSEVAGYLDQAVRNTFREERDPWGNVWPEWKHPAAIERARQRRDPPNYSVQKLIDTSEMYDSIKKSSDGNSAQVSMGDGISHPADVHQYGNGNIPARPMFPSRHPGEVDFPDEWFARVLAPINRELQKAAEDRQ